MSLRFSKPRELYFRDVPEEILFALFEQFKRISHHLLKLHDESFCLCTPISVTRSVPLTPEN